MKNLLSTPIETVGNAALGKKAVFGFTREGQVHPSYNNSRQGWVTDCPLSFTTYPNPSAAAANWVQGKMRMLRVNVTDCVFFSYL